MTAEGAHGHSSMQQISSFYGKSDEVTQICKFCCDEDEFVPSITSANSLKSNDILAIRHLNRVTVVQNNKILVSCLTRLQKLPKTVFTNMVSLVPTLDN